MSYLKRHFGSIFSKQKQSIYRGHHLNVLSILVSFRKGLLLALSFSAWWHAWQLENGFTSYTDWVQHFVDGEADTADVTYIK